MKTLTPIMQTFIAGLLSIFATSVALADKTSADIVAEALMHGDRPAQDRADDARRMPLEVLAFAGIEEGMDILEMEAGRGWYTEILARAVGPDGTVIMQNPPSFDNFYGDAPQQRADRFDNVRLSRTNFDQLDAADNSMDMVTWILGPHELWFELNGQSLGDPQSTFAEIERVLRPGGVFLAIDHHAEQDAGPEVGGTLHRIGESLITNMSTEAGLRLLRSSNLHLNPEDPLDIGMSDESISGRTSKFVVLFRK